MPINFSCLNKKPSILTSWYGTVISKDQDSVTSTLKIATLSFHMTIHLVIIHCDAGLEDSNPNILCDTLAHDDIPSHQFWLWKLQQLTNMVQVHLRQMDWQKHEQGNAYHPPPQHYDGEGDKQYKQWGHSHQQKCWGRVQDMVFTFDCHGMYVS